MFNIDLFTYPPEPYKMTRAVLKRMNPLLVARAKYGEIVESVYYTGFNFYKCDDWYSDQDAIATQVIIKNDWNKIAEYEVNGHKQGLYFTLFGTFYTWHCGKGSNNFYPTENNVLSWAKKNGLCKVLSVNRGWRKTLDAAIAIREWSLARAN